MQPNRVVTILLGGFTAAALVHALVSLFTGLDHLLLDLHGFRQTQTAITSYWIARGGPILAYETPVLGAPWAVPYEFPLYQLLVAWLHLAGVQLDVAGRLLSIAFLLATIWPVRILCTVLRIGLRTQAAMLILYLTCPLLLFWGRTFMIETCAAFFAALWLASTARWLEHGARRDAWLAVASGVLAILVKLTTFFPFGLLAGLVVLRSLYQRRSLPWLGVALVFGIPLLFGFGWTLYADLVKQHNALGRYLTSGALHYWTFGTWEQRFDPAFWKGALVQRSLPDLYGYATAAVPVLLACTALHRRYLVPMLACVTAALMTLLVFTNLYQIHNYYYVAIAVMGTAAAALGIGSLLESGRAALGAALLAGLCTSQLAWYYTGYHRVQTANLSQHPLYLVAKEAQRQTSDGDTLIVIGANDWSSEVAYYSQRKSLTLPYWVTAPVLADLLRDPSPHLGGRHLGGVVFCTATLGAYGATAPALVDFARGRRVLANVAPCYVLAPER